MHEERGDDDDQRHQQQDPPALAAPAADRPAWLEFDANATAALATFALIAARIALRQEFRQAFSGDALGFRRFRRRQCFRHGRNRLGRRNVRDLLPPLMTATITAQTPAAGRQGVIRDIIFSGTTWACYTHGYDRNDSFAPTTQ